jgi:predicted nucleic acid-binding protein
MTVYADTNFFTNLLVELPRSADADSLAITNREQGSMPLTVCNLLNFELINALQRLLYEAAHGTQKIRITRELALVAEAQFAEQLATGSDWRKCEPDSDLLVSIFNDVVHRHTAKCGFRTYDVLHVASALALGCDTFWSFDKKANHLAELEGLATI